MASTSTMPATDRAKGRGFLWAGIVLFVLAAAAVVVQYSLRLLINPWYFPALTTLAALAILAALAQRVSGTRIIAFLLMGGVSGFFWFALLVSARLPEYAGPARGQKLPAFHATLADGRSFTQADLEDGTPTVLTFFRGRW